MNGRQREVEHLGNLGLVTPTEVVQLDHLSFALVVGPQRLHRVIEVDQPLRAHLGQDRTFFQGLPLAIAAALLAEPPPGMIHEDLPHGSRRDTIKVDPVAEGEVATDEFEIGLVDQRGRVQGVVGAFAVHQAAGHPAQLLVDQREELCFDGGTVGLSG